MGLNSPWGNRGEIMKAYGFSYDYLLWGISWLNVQLMIADAPRISPKKQGGDEDSGKEVIHRELKSKEDIKNYIKGII
jgi:hypothetical protein